MKSQLNTKQAPIYGNAKVLDPDGNTLFLCLPKKAQWYLDRDLATMIWTEPLVIQLKFQPNGKGNTNDLYAISEKENKCVVCGCENDLTRHHIVPYTYRKHFPEHIKSHNSHDVVPICVKHHSEYEEQYGIELKYVFAQNFKAPLEQLTKTNTDLSIVVKYSKALMNHGNTIPFSRKKQMVRIIRDYHGQLNRMCNILSIYAYIDLNDSITNSHGKLVVDKLLETEQLQWFVETWREHFLESMTPKYMPEHWDVHRPVERTI